MTLKCSKCEASNTDGSQFCSHCGAKIQLEPDNTVSFYLPVDAGEEIKIDLNALGPERPLLLVIKGIGVGQTFLLTHKEIVIGRDPENDIFLDDITVSRRHAKLSKTDNKWTISDTGSLNGTYLNNQRVDKAYLANHDEIQVGKFKMAFIDNN